MKSIGCECSRIEQADIRRVVGLMSGTSVDGIDAALIEVSGAGNSLRLENVLATTEIPYDAETRQRIHDLFDGTTTAICEMNVVLGELFAQAAIEVIRESGLSPKDVHIIGSHGQTIYHIPRGGDQTPSSLQIGEISVIAERTGITTVGNFRARDIAAGGEGAPLVPYVDWALCHRDEETIALQNIGGIANVTVVTPGIQNLVAFDTGPGNMIIDAAVHLATEGEASYDKDGRMAVLRRPDNALVNELLQDQYFMVRPPKSTGREYWGIQYVQQLIRERNIVPGPQLVCDMTELTARSIHDAYQRHVLPHHDMKEVFLSGGGQRNPVLRRRLAELFAPVRMGNSGELGLPSDAKEAVAFAILANETVCGAPSNVPGATGAHGPRVLGVVCPA